jgi:Trk-type K+ transport system membrane component
VVIDLRSWWEMAFFGGVAALAAQPVLWLLKVRVHSHFVDLRLQCRSHFMSAPAILTVVSTRSAGIHRRSQTVFSSTPQQP